MERPSTSGATPLRARAFLDGRLGHEKQVRGVLQALVGLVSLEVEYDNIPSPSFRSGLRDWFHFLASPVVLPQDLAASEVDIVIGAGCYTHIPMILFRKACARQGMKIPRIITFMTPNFPLLSLVDLCFRPQADRPSARANVAVTVGPPNTALNRHCHLEDHGLILIGGLDTRTHHWDSAAILEQVRTLVERERAMTWTISSSPRTPAELIDSLRDFAGRKAGVGFFTAAETPKGWIEEQYDRNAVVWVTADSMSMVYEALTAGCGVGLLPVVWKKKESQFIRSEQYLADRKMVTPYADWLQGRQVRKNHQPLNEAHRCAEEILRRWWPEKLP